MVAINALIQQLSILLMEAIDNCSGILKNAVTIITDPNYVSVR